jgi:hypothetical protein
MAEVWDRRVPPYEGPGVKRTVAIELDEEEARSLSRLLARYVISQGDNPRLTDLAVKMGY